MGDQCYNTIYTSYSQTICGVACGIALQVVLKYKLFTVFPAWALGTAFACSLFGSFVYGIPWLDRYTRYHRTAQFLMHCVVVPLLSTHFSIVNKYDNDMSYVQLVFAVLPVLSHLVNDREQFTLQNFVISSTLAFKAYIHYQTNNRYGLGFCASYALFHFFIGSDQIVANIPVLVLQTTAFVFNQYLIIMALYH